MGRWIDVTEAESLLPGEFALIETEESELAVFNLDGSLHCIEDVCTHDGGTLVDGDVTGCIVTCPRHGAKFDIRTGEALTLPAVVPAPTFPVRVVDGMIQVEVGE